MSDGENSWSDESLFPGETVVWTGRPVSVRRNAGDVGLALFAAVIILLFDGIELKDHVIHGYPVGFMVLFSAVGIMATGQVIGMLVWFLALKPKALARQRYALTDRRLLISLGKPDMTVNSWYLDQLRVPQIKRHDDGTSDVRFGSTDRRARRNSLYWSVGNSAPSPTLFAINAVAGLTQQLAAVPASGEVGAEAEARPEVPVPDGVWTPRNAERVLWAGRPSALPWWFGSADFYQTLYGLFFPLFVLGMGVFAMTAGAPVIFLVWVAVMFLVACHISFGRVLWRRARFARSTYIVTDQRVVAVWKVLKTRVTDAEHGVLLPPQVTVGGSVFFRRAGQPGEWKANGWPSSLSPAATTEPPNFIGLADPGAVVEIVAALRLGLGFELRILDHEGVARDGGGFDEWGSA